MPYTTPTTRANGEYIGPTIWNNDVVENIKFLANPPACRIYRATNQSIPDNVETAISFSNARWNTDNMWTVGSPTRVTINTAGLYVITFTALVESAGDYALVFGNLRVNGTSHLLIGPTLRTTGITTTPAVFASTIWKFAVADYVEATVQQDNTTNVARNVIPFENGSPELAVTWIGRG